MPQFIENILIGIRRWITKIVNEKTYVVTHHIVELHDELNTTVTSEITDSTSNLELNNIPTFNVRLETTKDEDPSFEYTIDNLNNPKLIDTKISVLFNEPELITPDTWLVFSRWNKKKKKNTFVIGGTDDSSFIVPINMDNLYSEKNISVLENRRYVELPYTMKDLIVHGFVRDEYTYDESLTILIDAFTHGTEDYGDFYNDDENCALKRFYDNLIYSYGSKEESDNLTISYRLHIVTGKFYRRPGYRESGETYYKGGSSTPATPSGFLKVEKYGMSIPINIRFSINSYPNEDRILFVGNAGDKKRRYHRVISKKMALEP